MLSTNDAQSKKLNELLILSITPDTSGDCWKIKQIYFVPHTENIGECSRIVLVLFDKGENIMFYYIDYNGNHERRSMV